LPRSRISSRYVPAFCIAHTFRVELTDTYPARLYQRAGSGPPSGTAPSFVPGGTPYYGGSVTLGLASRRSSRICAHETLSMCRCPFVSLPRSLPGTHRRERCTDSGYISVFGAAYSSLRRCDVVASGMLRRAYDYTVGNLGSANAASPCIQDLRRVAIHTFWLSRFNAMLLSSLGFPAKSGIVLEVIRSQPLRPVGGISCAPKRRTSRS